MHSVKLKAFILASAAVTRINFLLLSPADWLRPTFSTQRFSSCLMNKRGVQRDEAPPGFLFVSIEFPFPGSAARLHLSPPPPLPASTSVPAGLPYIHEPPLSCSSSSVCSSITSIFKPSRLLLLFCFCLHLLHPLCGWTHRYLNSTTFTTSALPPVCLSLTYCGLFTGRRTVRWLLMVISGPGDVW